MEKIKLRVFGNVAEVTERPEIITSGTVGLPVEFTFDDSWAGLNKLTVFRAGDVAITVAEPGVVPWEVLEKPNVWLQIGVYGVNGDGTVVIPTLWTSVGVIHTGADPGEVAAEPTHTVWQEMLDRINAIKSDTASKEELDGHIANEENPHGVTAEQVGAAPAGYGLGKNEGRWTTDLNLAVRPGFYAISGDDATNLPTEHNMFKYGTLLVEKRTGTKQIKQTITYDNISAMRCSLDGGTTWEEWEYINPPMESDVEYRTIERRGEKAVYTKLSGGYVYYRLEDETSWTTSAAYLQAAPTGFGLGGSAKAGVADCNTLWKNGWYATTATANNRPGWFVGTCLVFCMSRSSSNAIQQAYEIESGNVATRQMVSGVWSEWECINPPMEIGVEYRTTERWNDLPVYTKLIDCGEIADGKTIDIVEFDEGGTPITIPAVIRYNAVLLDSSGSNMCPLPDGNARISVDNSVGIITLHNDNDYWGSDFSVQARIWYTK